MFIIYCALIGFTAAALIVLISDKVNNKLLACTLCCLLGMVVAAGIALLLIHSNNVDLGAII